MRSPTAHGLRFLESALRELETPQGPKGPTLAIRTAAVVEHPAFGEVVAAAVRSEEGVFAQASDHEDGRYVRLADMSTTELLRDFVRSINVALDGEGRGDVVVGLDDTMKGQLRFVVNGEAVPAPDSYRRLVGILNAIASLCGTGADLATIVFSDRGLDKDLARAVWEFLCGHLPSLGLRGPRRLLVVLLTPWLDPDIYYARPYPIECLVDARGCHLRTGARQNNESVRELATLSGPDTPLVLFLGAGTSVSSGMPLGNALRDRALRGLLGLSSSTAADDLPEQFYSWLKARRRMLAREADMTLEAFKDSLTLERVLREEFRQTNGRANSPTLNYFSDLNSAKASRVGQAVTALRRIVACLPSRSNRRLVLVTVNFDTLLEHERESDLKIFRSNADFEGAANYLEEYRRNGGLVPYLKIHGSIEERETVIASVTQTLGVLPQSKTNALRALYVEGRHPRMVYVGCSMRDLDLAPILTSSEWSTRLDERWVSPLVDDNVRRFADEHRLARWQELARDGGYDPLLLEDRTITDTADTFLNELAVSLSC